MLAIWWDVCKLLAMLLALMLHVGGVEAIESSVYILVIGNAPKYPNQYGKGKFTFIVLNL